MPLSVAGFGPLALAIGFGSVWVAMPATLPYSAASHGALWRLSPDLARVEARIPVGWAPASIAVTATAVWVADSRGDGSNPHGRQDLVERVDPGSDSVTDSIAVADPQRIVAVAGAIWVVPGARDGTTDMLRISDSGAAAVTAAVTGTVSDVQVDGADLWIATNGESGGSGTLLRADATSGTIVATIPLGADIGGVLAASGRILAIESVGATDAVGVRTIDPAANAPSGPVRRSGALVGSALRVVGDHVWVGNQGAIASVDLRSLLPDTRPLSVLDAPGSSVIAIDGDAGALWVLTGTGVVRIIETLPAS
ncbi:MAG TPA: hypothetical protein VNF73_12465 [Candidatus Saccharimonadales bacterium]|nr:hypothetical protein [Candidatus Saccharimonadales bacterium]